ncbi:unnamed protein product [Hymenolepis diminuta]|uniref:Uncharacterized protein n=1 Tax=Hymenolepis diminuta TaxID=6216 RepID=A0A564YCI5_HYMDI|nr:unnamed protein product [Hymenolepis diminuta]
MEDLPHATRITVLLREFNESDNYLCSSNPLPMDSADKTYEKMISIVSRLCTIFRFGLSKRTNSDISFSFLVSDHLAML